MWRAPLKVLETLTRVRENEGKLEEAQPVYILSTDLDIVKVTNYRQLEKGKNIISGIVGVFVERQKRPCDKTKKSIV